MKINQRKNNIFNKKYDFNQGFTLIELLVVLGIIALLTTLVIVGVNYARNKAKIAKAQHDIDTIYSAISILANDTNEWSAHQTVNTANSLNGNEICADGCTYGLGDDRAGLVADDGTYNGWNGPYMIKMPTDPWEREYFFDTSYRVTPIDGLPCNGTGGCIPVAVVGSYGPDGVGNNLFNADDIIKIIAK